MTPKQLAKAIEQLGLTQIRIAELLGIPNPDKTGRRTLTHWLAGDRTIPASIEMLVLLLLDGTLTQKDLDRVRPNARPR